ncbi:YdcF family protein [Mucilaginibacter sp.]|uniref:YdcF family protein n=1 Tax=Mucilaginibacter sp. TaxID=1882438 RepID=UPI003D096D1A
MKNLKNLRPALLITCLILTFCNKLAAQVKPTAGYDKNYHFLHSDNLVADKNFYLLTVIDQSPKIKQLIADDASLKQFFAARLSILKAHVADTCTKPLSLVGGFKYSKEDSVQIAQILTSLYNAHRSDFDLLINNHLRPSGYYQRFAGMSNADLLLHAWGQYIYGVNYIIDQFGLGKKMRFPRIDSASYVVSSRYYRTVLKDMFGLLDEQSDGMKLFYQPSLAVALHLMDANDRDEPARFEPMEQKDNKKAISKIKLTQWSKYPYAAIVIPGNGPELFTTPISPDNKIHCDLAAMRYLKGMAPFIITSGGYCYPFRGPYCEAIEMKKYLITKFGIPEDAIIIDPHARHTTTNIRNADRLMIRYGIPTNKPDLFVTSKSQHDYAMSDTFDARNLHDLGYVPYSGKKSISNHDVVFYPVYESLHMDPLDPLDP